MWGSLSRSRRAAVKRGALVFVILVGIVGAVDKVRFEEVRWSRARLHRVEWNK
jgi:hypothetical protein|tara:strand:+ start:2183 stop:2341 length:159 start_codon:yes stop_codon:yes gene_type:complete